MSARDRLVGLNEAMQILLSEPELDIAMLKLVGHIERLEKEATQEDFQVSPS